MSTADMPVGRTKTALSAAQIISLGFLAIILVGATLLSLPISSADRTFTSFSDCIFTSVSSTCVTGLVVVDTAEHWSLFGKSIILLLIQIGGLGFMAMVFLISLVLRRSVTPREKYIFAQSMNLPTNEKLTSFLWYIVSFTFAVEFAGAVLLAFRFIPEYGVADGIAKSIFHSVSAFCNAGFDTLPGNSLEGYADDVFVNVVIMLLIVIGGVGFIVWREIMQRFTRKNKLSVYSRTVLAVTALLIVGGAAFFYVTERSNLLTAGDTEGATVLRSLFQSVTFRTAGFNSVDMSSLTPISKLFSLVLMFIGGSSGSTAGGIKTVTLACVFIAVANILMGRNRIRIGRWELSRYDVLRAFALVCTGIIATGVVTVAVSAIENVDLLDSAFEVFSAFGTVGVSTGITPSLGLASRIMLMLLMFFGRVGLFTVSFATLMRLNRDSAVRYPATKLIIG